MGSERYIRVPVITHQNKIYKYDEVEYVEDEYYGNHYKVPGSRDMIHEFKDFVYDLKKKKFIEFTTVEFKPETSYKIGETVYLEKSGSHHKLTPDEILDIKYEEFKASYNKFSKLDTWYKNLIPTDEMKLLKENDMIEVKEYEPTYIFKSGYSTKYTHQIYKVEE